MTHSELVEIARQWILKGSRFHSPCSVVTTELVSYAGEVPDAIGWNHNTSVLVECKTSRADYRSDQKKVHRSIPSIGIGEYRYYMAPTGLLSVDEIPSKWGLLEVSLEGKVRVVRQSAKEKTNRRNEIIILVSLLRRLKLEPQGHMAIKAYTHEGRGSDSKATITISPNEQLCEDLETK